MTLSICLTLDGPSDRAVRALWRRLEDAGVPTLASHTHGRHVPHLTLASLRSWDLEALGPELAGLRPLEPETVAFDAVGMFRRSRCWLVPAPTHELLHRQEAVAAAARRSGADLHRHYEPGQWVPHLTLAPRLRLDDLPVVAARVYDVLPLRATLSRLTLVDTSTGTQHLIPPAS
ncbi:MAG: 2'-5' RNA ligase family protein [Marmoricola sp.]